MSGSMSVTFWGVRGSHPTPGEQTVRVGGNTLCVQVCAGKHMIILDAGTGIINLGRALVNQSQIDKKPITATLLFTHAHHDHTQGFPFFTPMHFQSTTLYIFGPKPVNHDLEQVLAQAMLPPVFPITLDQLPCVRIVRNLNEGEVIALNKDRDEPNVFLENRTPPPPGRDEVRIHVLRSYAHPQNVFVYRIEYDGKSVVYATDTEGYTGGDQRLIRFARGANLLIHDAQYTESEYANALVPRQGWGHSTWQMATEVAQAAAVQQLVLYHHDPHHNDDALERLEQEAQKVCPSTFLAREGIKIEL